MNKIVRLGIGNFEVSLSPLDYSMPKSVKATCLKCVLLQEAATGDHKSGQQPPPPPPAVPSPAQPPPAAPPHPPQPPQAPPQAPPQEQAAPQPASAPPQPQSAGLGELTPSDLSVLNQDGTEDDPEDLFKQLGDSHFEIDNFFIDEFEEKVRQASEPVFKASVFFFLSIFVL